MYVADVVLLIKYGFILNDTKCLSVLIHFLIHNILKIRVPPGDSFNVKVWKACSGKSWDCHIQSFSPIGQKGKG
jgi:hypothetical protein